MQVAIDLTKPRGRVLGVDLIPVQPPKGVSTIQGNFLSPDIQAEIKAFLRDPDRGRLRQSPLFHIDPSSPTPTTTAGEPLDQITVEAAETGYLERQHSEAGESMEEDENSAGDKAKSGGSDGGNAKENHHEDKTVDVVLSDMCEPWDPLDGMSKRMISNPYRRLMNTSGNAFRDHAGSMVCIPHILRPPFPNCNPILYTLSLSIPCLSETDRIQPLRRIYAAPHCTLATRR